MILVTGDIHANIDIHKLSSNKFPLGNSLTRKDYLIICGDFGLVWDNSKKEKWWREWLNNKPWTTLFIDGNHENFDLLNSYPVTNKWGGKVHQIEDNIYHLMRGQVFDIDNKKIFTFGGAKSHDKDNRVKGISWWENELPTQDEMDEGIKNLEENNWNIDYIITHCCPSATLKQIPPKYKIEYKTDYLTDYLQKIDDKLNYKNWFCGHYHIDTNIENKKLLYYNIASDSINLKYDTISRSYI